MPKSKTNQPNDYITTPDGLITTPPDSPKILIHTRQGRVVGIFATSQPRFCRSSPRTICGAQATELCRR